jgi:hypothetical protein
MSLITNNGGLFTQQPGAPPVTWFTTYPNGTDRRIVIQAPNIVDDVMGVIQLTVVSQAVQASNSGLAYLVTIHNPSTQAVTYNLNIQDPL